MSNSAHYALKGKRIWVAGHRGMVGSAVVRRLASENCDVVTADRGRADLTDAAAVSRWMDETRPHAVVLAAARVGGIWANDTQPADFLYDNLMIASNVIHAAHRADVEKLLFLGSSCIYPRMAKQPIEEDELLTGPLEPTNEWYAIAKIAGIKLCQAYRKQHGRDFISAMPTNLYGKGDNYDLDTSHVVPALIRKMHEARLVGSNVVTVWGSGSPRREFLHVDDLADALVHLLRCYSEDQHINVGFGDDLSIRDLARAIANVVGFKGELTFDRSKPDGTPRKLLDSSRISATGWVPRIGLSEGLARTYRDFVADQGQT